MTDEPPTIRSTARENAQHFAHSAAADPLSTDQAIALAHVYALMDLTDAVAANRPQRKPYASGGVIHDPFTAPGYGRPVPGIPGAVTVGQATVDRLLDDLSTGPSVHMEVAPAAGAEIIERTRQALAKNHEKRTEQ